MMKKTLISSCLVVLAVTMLVVGDAAAQGRGGGRGGQRGRSGATRNGAQMAQMYQQMMRYRYRYGQSGGGCQSSEIQQSLADDPYYDSYADELIYGSRTGQGQAGGQGRGRGGQRGQGRGGQQGSGRGQGRGRQGRNALSSGLTSADYASLTEMREEEKLAHDVYRTLANQWNEPLFSNIAASEQRHMSALDNLMRRQDAAQVAEDDSVGVFTNPKYAQLYKELTETGGRSLPEAYQVGVKIEEMDIADLERALKETNNATVRRVYSNLLRGSKNHLRAFSSRL